MASAGLMGYLLDTASEHSEWFWHLCSVNRQKLSLVSGCKTAIAPPFEILGYLNTPYGTQGLLCEASA